MTQIEVRKKILAENEARAATLRERFDARGALVLNLISSPGSGKTSLLEATARRMADEVEMGALVGDIATELDAERLRAAGLPAHQIVTAGACHLDARFVEDALAAAPFALPELLFVENVGNLVCPASYVLGEDYKVALLSVTEGADKPFKYPAIFTRAAVTLITKVDLAEHVDFDLAKVREHVLSLNPAARVLELSVRTGQGLDAWCALLREGVAAKRGARAEALA
ncbi:MAG: hydrogenase nickel incorporation protein HypB [Planctomycetes bacterium]|nr:hydrogenase nickel incorporation protein HypB [Planctomycetota bacterium]